MQTKRRTKSARATKRAKSLTAKAVSGGKAKGVKGGAALQPEERRNLAHDMVKV